MTRLNPSIRHECPSCASRDVRISAEICCTVKPNDERDPIVNYQFLDFDVEWESHSDARCEACGWEGLAGDLRTVAATPDDQPVLPATR